LRKVNVDDENPDAPVIKDNIVDLYGERLKVEKWDNKTLFHSVVNLLPNLCLSTFTQNYLCGKNSVIKKRLGDSDSTIPIFSPNLKSTKNKPTYSKYCFFALIKYKPWVDYKEQVFSDDIADKDKCIDLDKIDDDMKDKIISGWHTYLEDPDRKDNLDDPIMREVDRLQQAHERDEMIDDNMIRSQDGVFDRDDHQPDYTSIYEGIMRKRNDEDITAMKWDETHDHNGNIDNMINSQIHCEDIAEKWKIKTILYNLQCVALSP
jgi:hypothetical protein